MLQIKNTLGGGKPEGLYVWKKNEVEYTSQNELDSDNMILIDNSSASAVRIYYSTSYSFDASTGLYTLNNPIASDVSYGKTQTINGGNYVTLDSPSSPTMYTNNSISYTFYVDNGASTNREIMIALNSNKDELKTYSAKANFTFIDYIVSDKETAYPDGGEKGGYWYEKVVEGISPEMFGLTKMAVDKYTPTAEDNLMTIPHSLGETPKIAILIADKNDVGEYLSSNGTYVYVFFAYMSHMSDNKYPYGYDEGLYTNGTKRYGKLNPIASGSGTNKSSLNETKVIFVFQYTDTTYTYYGYYKKGVEYTLITMA